MKNTVHPAAWMKALRAAWQQRPARERHALLGIADIRCIEIRGQQGRNVRQDVSRGTQAGKGVSHCDSPCRKQENFSPKSWTAAKQCRHQRTTPPFRTRIQPAGVRWG